MVEITTNKERIMFLTENYDLTKNAAKALILTEMGITHSGIASLLSVNKSTAKRYLNDLESEIGPHVTETVPKSVKYPTFPDSIPKSDISYSGDVVELTPQFDDRDVPHNKGIKLSEIDSDLMTAP